MAWDPGLVIKNQRTQGLQFNDPKISAGFTGSGFPPWPLDKSLLPLFIYFSGGIEFIKLGNNLEELMKFPSYQGKKNKIKKTSIVEVKLPVDWMTNKGKVPKTNISHSQSFTAPPAALLFSFL